MQQTQPVMWSKGTFLRQQHFQQQDRYTESAIFTALRRNSFHWGFLSRPVVDPSALNAGAFTLSTAEGIFRDGTQFDIAQAGRHPSPPAIAISPEDVGKVVYLCTTKVLSGHALVSQSRSDARYFVGETTIRDDNTEHNDTATIQIRQLNLWFEVAGEAEATRMPVARIAAVNDSKQVQLDSNFIPPILALSASHYLMSEIEQLAGDLVTRWQQLTANYTPAAASAAALIDAMQIQAVSNARAKFAHFSEAKTHHPDLIFQECLALMGGLAPFIGGGKSWPTLPKYDHDDLNRCFPPLLKQLRAAFDTVSERRAEALKLNFERQVHYSQNIPEEFVKSAEFVLMARADMPAQQFCVSLPRLATITAIQEIGRHVNEARSSIDLQHIPQQPTELPTMPGWLYFRIDRNNPLWNNVIQQQNIGMHFSQGCPNLELQLWVIRSDK